MMLMLFLRLHLQSQLFLVILCRPKVLTSELNYTNNTKGQFLFILEEQYELFITELTNF